MFNALVKMIVVVTLALDASVASAADHGAAPYAAAPRVPSEHDPARGFASQPQPCGHDRARTAPSSYRPARGH